MEEKIKLESEFENLNKIIEENESKINFNELNCINVENKIKSYFESLSFLSENYCLGTKYWEENQYILKNNNYKLITYHNNVSKLYHKFIEDMLIKKMRKNLEDMKIEFYYKKHKEQRYNKTLEFIFIFKIKIE